MPRVPQDGLSLVGHVVKGNPNTPSPALGCHMRNRGTCWPWPRSSALLERSHQTGVFKCEFTSFGKCPQVTFSDPPRWHRAASAPVTSGLPVISFYRQNGLGTGVVEENTTCFYQVCPPNFKFSTTLVNRKLLHMQEHAPLTHFVTSNPSLLPPDACGPIAGHEARNFWLKSATFLSDYR